MVGENRQTNFLNPPQTACIAMSYTVSFPRYEKLSSAEFFGTWVVPRKCTPSSQDAILWGGVVFYFTLL